MGLVATVLRFKRCSAANGPESLLQKGLLAYDSDESIVLHQRGVFGGLVFGHGTRGSGASARAGRQRGGAGTGWSMVTGRGEGALSLVAWEMSQTSSGGGGRGGQWLHGCRRIAAITYEMVAVGAPSRELDECAVWVTTCV